ncbi:MAG: hypothetical protein OP8BY_0434 [Candidatus Saccharicenans subterraneus]|uniref:Uncharacterized protein n=1 Tax=Candidatus Saccharicenans subterraneus TaxID=2508984 RepID=A0A3E2BKQ0_9BACT|nr:MAG: hypothetical protein OP8BY_0434 [Candidatus Saccharicenans subterraneum]
MSVFQPATLLRDPGKEKEKVALKFTRGYVLQDMESATGKPS